MLPEILGCIHLPKQALLALLCNNKIRAEIFRSCKAINIIFVCNYDPVMPTEEHVIFVCLVRMADT
jgi:hypothetical protein